jgi:sugar O-acyltransferase (sialic acid O-acetyltransferase NeuD family)
MKIENSDSALPLVILGAGGMGRETAWLVRMINQEIQNSWNLLGFLVREIDPARKFIGKLPLLDLPAIIPYLPNLHVVAAIGNPVLRKRAVLDIERLNCHFATLIHPGITFEKDSISIGAGTVICAGSFLSVNVSVGNHVIINMGSTIAHDCVLEDYATISPGCHLAGNSVIREGGFLGIGSSTIEGKEIGAWSVIGAGGVVIDHIPSGVTAVGVPARVIPKIK